MFPKANGSYNEMSFYLAPAQLNQSYYVLILTTILAPLLLVYCFRVLFRSPDDTWDYACADERTLKKKCAYIMNRFLHEISYRYPGTEFDYTLKKRVEDYMTAQAVSPEMIERIQPYIDPSIDFTITCYSHTSPQIQEAVALYTSYAISIDDLGHEFPDEMKTFVSQLLRGQSHQNKLLRETFQFLIDFGPRFGPFARDMIAKSTMDFVCGCYLELEQEKINHFTAAGPEFAEYLRLKTGVAETYAYFLFPEDLFPEEQLLHTYLPAIPYIVQYFNYVNDILSFYKEAGERANFINNYARATKLSPFRSLEMAVQKAIDIFHMINAILSPNQELQETVERFMYGYIAYHLCARRYKLSELDIPDVDLTRRQLFRGS